MGALQRRVEGRLHDSGHSPAGSQCGGKRSGIVTGPGHGYITATKPVTEQWIVGRGSCEQRRAGGRLHGKPAIHQTAIVQKLRRVGLSTEQHLAAWKGRPEPADGGHCQQEVAQTTGMQDDDRARHDVQEDGFKG